MLVERAIFYRAAHHYQEAREDFEKQNERIQGLETELEEKSQIIQSAQDKIAELEDKLEKQQWLYEEFFKNKGRAVGSKLEKYVRESMKKRMKRK